MISIIRIYKVRGYNIITICEYTIKFQSVQTKNNIGIDICLYTIRRVRERENSHRKCQNKKTCVVKKKEKNNEEILYIIHGELNF